MKWRVWGVQIGILLLIYVIVVGNASLAFTNPSRGITVSEEGEEEEEQSILSSKDNWTWSVYPFHISLMEMEKQDYYHDNQSTWIYYDVKNISTIVETPDDRFDFVETNIEGDFLTYLYEINLTKINGAGELIVDINITYSQSFSKNDTTNIIFDHFNESNYFFWDMKEEITAPDVIEWTYIDYNYWGPNPAWRIKIDEDQIRWKKVDDREHRFEDDMLYHSNKIKDTPPQMWEKIKEHTINHQAFNWDTFGFRTGRHTCDGPAHRNTVVMTFENTEKRIVEDYDYTDCDSYETWVPDGFFGLEDLLWDAVNSTDADTELSILSIDILPIFMSMSTIFLLFTIMIRNKKIKL